MILETDVTQTTSIQATLRAINETFGKPPFVVVNSAGISPTAHILKLDEHLFDKIININLKVRNISCLSS